MDDEEEETPYSNVISSNIETLRLSRRAEEDENENEEEEDIDENQNGFHNVVPATLAELTAVNEESHTNITHLVDGDFFPEDSPSRVELCSENNNNNVSVDNFLQPQHIPDNEQKDKGEETPNKKEQQEKEKEEKKSGVVNNNNNNNNNNNKEADVHSCPLLFAKSHHTVRRVRWADEVTTSPTPLVQHATTFLLPNAHQSPHPIVNPTLLPSTQTPYISSEAIDKTPQTLPPPPVLREEVNTDGSIYISCRAQRPAPRFVLWRRQQKNNIAGIGVGGQQLSGGVAPFRLQPQPQPPMRDEGLPTASTSESSTTPTSPPLPPHSHSHPRPPSLLAALHPPYSNEENLREAGATTVRLRVACVDEGAKRGGALCDGGLQMPMVRVSEVRNMPLHIPF